ncbi:alcohol dehydrogenase catalytic domain-containing protein, partial [bacterium]|nr:alcohol dehydrogenase catalytic domain-containing protein [bacterium]
VNEIEVGSWVAVDPNTRCGECQYCLAGASHHCERSEETRFHPRGLAKYQDLHHSYLHPLPIFNPIYIGALAEPLSCALHAIARAQISPGDNVLILGAGSMGSMVAFALLNKFDSLAITMHDTIPQRVDRFIRHFPGRVNNYVVDDIQDEYTAIFEATGDPEALHIATQSVAKRGKIVVISRYRNRENITLPTTLCQQEIDVRFSHLNGPGETIDEALALLKQNGAQDYLELVEIHSLDQIHTAIQRMQSSSYCKTMIEIDGSME